MCVQWKVTSCRHLWQAYMLVFRCARVVGKQLVLGKYWLRALARYPLVHSHHQARFLFVSLNSYALTCLDHRGRRNPSRRSRRFLRHTSGSFECFRVASFAIARRRRRCCCCCTCKFNGQTNAKLLRQNFVAHKHTHTLEMVYNNIVWRRTQTHAHNGTLKASLE